MLECSVRFANKANVPKRNGRHFCETVLDPLGPRRNVARNRCADSYALAATLWLILSVAERDRKEVLRKRTNQTNHHSDLVSGSLDIRMFTNKVSLPKRNEIESHESIPNPRPPLRCSNPVCGPLFVMSRTNTSSLGAKLCTFCFSTLLSPTKVHGKILAMNKQSDF